ncbi:SulP family inorganic anion transporter [Streptomyces tardus]|uniref:SulP family inorganic anion transporter n=1 Tax=Streptomyces tardus TaxID=2780544 RepID=UPI001EEB0E1F
MERRSAEPARDDPADGGGHQTGLERSSGRQGDAQRERERDQEDGDGRGAGGGSADLSASVSVFLIALPLSLGIALATGAPLQAGLVAAAVGGIVAGRFGGAPLQVSGPAAGLTVVTAELIQQYGWRATCAITVVAGLAQLVLAYVRVARSARRAPRVGTRAQADIDLVSVAVVHHGLCAFNYPQGEVNES